MTWPGRATAAVLAVGLVSSACASTRSIAVVPLHGQAPEQVQIDRDECEALAARQRDRLVFVKIKAATLIGGLVVGAVLGLLFGLTTPTSGTPREAAAVVVGGAAIGAGVGLVIGEVGGTARAAREHRAAESAYLDRYVRCLAERGYRTAP
jgi:hypothetical protein